MTISRAEATFVTVCYGDIFDYPLTDAELVDWLVFYKGKPDTKFAKLYSPHIIAIRKSRERVSIEKWQTIKKIAWLYKFIPTVELVGVTGGLAMNNAAKEDDIDLFFIVSPKTLWVSRFLATMLTEIIGVRRRPGDTKYANKVCLNMFMTSDHLQLPKNERDIFSAHEVMQMKPLWERRKAYQKFLNANSWVEKFLPNAWDRKVKSEKLKVKSKKSMLRIFEWPSKMLQLWYMKRHKTNEITTDTVIRFHPHDARAWVKESLARRLEGQNLPLDKIFFNR